MLNFDFQIFQLINDGFSNNFFDWLAPILREKKTWIPLYIVLLVWTIFRYRQKAILFVLLAILTVGASDFTASSIVKPLVKRIRPCNNQSIELLVHKRIGCSGGYSFPSSHASNHFALALFLALTVFRKNRAVKIAGFIWATLIAFSQVYVGVHYPLDVFGGAIFGMLIALIIFTISGKIWPEYINSIQR